MMPGLLQWHHTAASPPQVSAGDVGAFLATCQHPDGGFGGGPQQLPHLAPTYAAVAALATLGGRALDVIHRAGVARFISRMAVPAAQGGGFQVCDGAAPAGAWLESCSRLKPGLPVLSAVQAVQTIWCSAPVAVSPVFACSHFV